MENNNIDEILSLIKSDKFVSLFDIPTISLSDLLKTDETNTTYLEYALSKKSKIPYYLTQQIKNNKEALYICAKYNDLTWLYRFDNEDIFFETIDNGKTLIEYIIENDVKVDYSFYSNIKNHYEIIDMLIKYNHDFTNLSKDLCEKLFIENNGSFLIDKYVNNQQFMNYIKRSVRSINLNILLNYSKKSNNYDLLRYSSENQLLTTLDNGKILIEELLDNNFDPLFWGYDFQNSIILDILYKRGRVDLFYNASIELLLSNIDSNTTYFDIMIKEHNNGKNVNFDKLSFSTYGHKTEVFAKLIMTMAKNNLIGYIPSIKKGMLLYKGKNDEKNVLECLLEEDAQITKNIIIGRCSDRYDEDFVIALRNLGIEDTLIRIKDNKKQFTDLNNDEFNNSYLNNLEPVQKELLNELKELFYNDGKSDKEIIDTLIISYGYLLTSNKDFAEEEIKQLISIKKNNYEKFVYIKNKDKSFFSLTDGSVNIDKLNISTINHETSHALHFYLGNNYTPNNYFEIIERIRNNPETIKKVGEHTKKYKEIKDNLDKTIPEDKIKEYYNSKYKDESILELAMFLSDSKEKQKEAFKDKYHEQVLDTILASTYSVDEYILQRIEIEKKEYIDSILRNNYSAIIAISDIIDAIYLGKYRNGVLMDNNGEYIDRTYGHGISYYSISTHGFDEMIADYGEILKSKDSDNMIEYLQQNLLYLDSS